MKYSVAALTDKGNVKKTNQDSAFVKVVDSDVCGQIVFAVVCDGMGGLEKGEVASATVARTLLNWFDNVLPTKLPLHSFDDITAEWNHLIQAENRRIGDYGVANNVSLGTTLAALLLIGDEYLLVNVGDSRVYQITNDIKQLTEDQTFVAREIKRGRMTPEQAKTDPRRNMLLQCVGASKTVTPELQAGHIEPDSVFMLCSDGFRHVITNDEIYECFNFGALKDKETMNKNCQYLVDTVKSRNERDNITVVLVKCMK